MRRTFKILLDALVEHGQGASERANVTASLRRRLAEKADVSAVQSLLGEQRAELRACEERLQRLSRRDGLAALERRCAALEKRVGEAYSRRDAEAALASSMERVILEMSDALSTHEAQVSEALRRQQALSEAASPGPGPGPGPGPSPGPGPGLGSGRVRVRVRVQVRVRVRV